MRRLQGGQYSGRLAKAVGALQGTQDSLQGDPIHTSEEKLIQGSEGREGPAGPGGLEGTAGPDGPEGTAGPDGLEGTAGLEADGRCSAASSI